MEAIGVSVQGTEVKVDIIRTSPVVRKKASGPRGAIKGFSAKSRRTLLSYVNRLDVSGGAVFLTLTYPDSYPDERRAKAHLEAFRKRLEHSYGKHGAIWRLEYQRRGAPHFHVLLFDMPFVPKAWYQRAWGGVIGYDRPFTRVEWVRGRRKVLMYVAKYMGKEGDRVGLTNSHNARSSAGPGRFWGMWRRELLPWADKWVKVVSWSEVVYHSVRRILAHIWPGLLDLGVTSYRVWCSNMSEAARVRTEIEHLLVG